MLASSTAKRAAVAGERDELIVFDRVVRPNQQKIGSALRLDRPLGKGPAPGRGVISTPILARLGPGQLCQAGLILKGGWSSKGEPLGGAHYCKSGAAVDDGPRQVIGHTLQVGAVREEDRRVQQDDPGQ